MLDTLCLINKPTAAEFGEHAARDSVRIITHHAPLGILALAAVLEERGESVSIVDLNRLYYERLESGRSVDGFAEAAARRLADQGRDLYGFSTICSSYPLTIRIARALRGLRPEATIVFGGPQASVVARETLERFSFVDLVVRGEAEESFPAAVAALRAGGDLSGVPGISWRAADGAIAETPAAAVLMDLDALPLPAFHLLPGAGEQRYLPLELGRGCPYACTFCSTNDFFRRRFRLKSPSRMLEHMRALRDRYGTESFSLVHDMFTVDRRKVLAFCDAMEGQGFIWSCSARTDRTDPELLRRMAEVGCQGIFFGIETGSRRLQKIIKKRLDLDGARRAIAVADDVGMDTEVSLIAGFPEETPEDLADTVAFFADSLRFENASPNIGLLSPLSKTPLHLQHRHELLYDGIQSDMSFQGWRLADEDQEMILADPDIFSSFYVVPTPHQERRRLVTAREFVVRGEEWARVLLSGLHQDSGDLLGVMDRWLAWRGEPAQLVPELDGGAPWFATRAFPDELLRFVEEVYLPEMAQAPLVIETLIRYERAFGAAATQPPAEAPARAAGPQPSAGVVTIEVPLDYEGLKRCLRDRGDLTALPHRPTLLAARRERGKATKVVQLTPLLAGVMSRCDGRPAAEIAAWLASTGALGDVPPASACGYALRVLVERGLVALPAASRAQLARRSAEAL